MYVMQYHAQYVCTKQIGRNRTEAIFDKRNSNGFHDFETEKWTYWVMQF